MRKKLTNILSDLLNESKITNKRLESIEKRVENLEENSYKTNAAIGELRIFVMPLADELLNIYQMDLRLKVIENRVLNKAS